MPTEKRKMSTSPRASASGVASSTMWPPTSRAGRARRGEDADVLEAVLAEQAEGDRADGARAADDADAGVAGHGLRVASARASAEGQALAAARRGAAERDLVGVLEVAADREAAREPRDAHLLAQAVGEVGGGRLAGHRRVRREHDLGDAVRVDTVDQLVDPQVGRIDAVDRAERAAEHVVEAVVGVRALERDDVDRLLDDADRRVVAARVEADRAGLLLGQVPALAAEADALLHLGERRRERERLLRRPLQDVEREPLRRPLPDSRAAASAARRGSRPKG